VHFFQNIKDLASFSYIFFCLGHNFRIKDESTNFDNGNGVRSRVQLKGGLIIVDEEARFISSPKKYHWGRANDDIAGVI